MTKYLKYIFAVSFICNFSFADDIDAGWNNFQNSLLNDLSGMEISFSTVVEKYNVIDGKLDTIINYANSLPSDYTSIKSSIVNYANQCKQSCSYGIATVNDLRTSQSSMVSTVFYMDYPSVSSGGSSSVDPSITNDLKKVIQHLSKIQEYDSYTLGKIQELIQTNRPIRDSMTNLLYFVQHNILSSMSSVQYNTQQISTKASSILTELSTIESKFDSLATDVFGIRYSVNRLYTSFTSFLDSWLTHADHQDNFYYNTTNYLNEILFNLINSTNNDFNLNYDFTNILYSIYLDLASNTNILSRWKSQISRGNDPRVDNWEYYQPKTKTDGSYNGSLRNKTLGDAIMSRIYESLWSSSPSLPYDPLLELTLLNYYSDQALTASVNWQSLIHANTIRLKDEIPDTLHNIATSLTNLHFQSLTATVPGLEILTNNVPIASLNHASWDWHMFFTNFYMYASLGPENYNITNVGVSSTWHDSTNWFNRIEALLAALVFKDDNSGRVNTNVVSTSATESAVSDVTTSLRSVVEIDNSFSQNVSSSANTIIDMLTEWTQQITSSAQLKGSFDMFNIPHLPVDDSQVHPGDSPASGDWAFRISVDDTDFGGFVHFLRSLTTVLWLCVFMFFALKMSLFLLICICKFVYFCYVVFSAMMGGD